MAPALKAESFGDNVDSEVRNIIGIFSLKDATIVLQNSIPLPSGKFISKMQASTLFVSINFLAGSTFEKQTSS